MLQFTFIHTKSRGLWNVHHMSKHVASVWQGNNINVCRWRFWYVMAIELLLSAFVMIALLVSNLFLILVIVCFSLTVCGVLEG